MNNLYFQISQFIMCIWMASLQCGFARDFLSGLISVSPVWVLSLFFKLPACENVFIHLEDLNALSPVWVLSCFFKWCDLEKFLSHLLHQGTWHWKTLCAHERNISRVDPLMGFQVTLRRSKILSHFEQLKGFPSVWVLSCSFKELDLEKHLSQFMHLNGFSPVTLSNLMLRSSCHSLCTWLAFLPSPVWVISCSFKWPAIEKLLSRFEQLKCFTCVGPVMLLQGTWSWKTFVTLFALECLFSSVSPSNLMVRS